MWSCPAASLITMDKHISIMISVRAGFVSIAGNTAHARPRGVNRASYVSTGGNVIHTRDAKGAT